MNELLKKIKRIRAEKGITQFQMCEKIGLNQANYSHFETGNRQITIERLEKIAKVFNMSVIELLGDESDFASNKENEKLKNENEDLKIENRDLKIENKVLHSIIEKLTHNS